MNARAAAKRAITDPEVLVLATIATTIQADYRDDDRAWDASPFAWIRTRPSRQRGKIGEQLIAGYLAAKDFDVAKSPDSQADKLINSHRVEIKFSTLWKSGHYTFQQLRDQEYELAILLGISPFDAHCWVLPKQEILRRWRARDGIESQHTGAGGADTAWLTVAPDAAPAWLDVFGGRLSTALQALRRAAPRPRRAGSSTRTR